MDILTVTNLSLTENGFSALQPISFTQKQGQKLALAGESGAGKSTLLQMVAGLIQPSTGVVQANGSRVRGPQDVLVPGHPGVAYLSQKSDLPQFLRVEQVLRYANKRPDAEAQAVYGLCRIAHLMLRRTDQLSGGEQQRVALARLLLGAPQLLLLDEPFSNLDRTHKRLLQGIIEELGTRLGITCLLVSHDAADVLGWADKILVLHRGRLVQQGTPQQLYHQPVDEATAALFGDYNLVHGADRRALLPGRRFKKDTALLVRPEQLQLRPAAGSGAVGTVRAVRFLGSYSEVEVALVAQNVRVRMDTTSLRPGDKTSLSLAAGAGWHIALAPAAAQVTI
ncbi:ABC-type Fe3+/spermidine/putrescine transport system ATPase subunit [Hymenobacter sp. UYAg731]